MELGCKRHKDIAERLPQREASHVASHIQKLNKNWIRIVNQPLNSNFVVKTTSFPTLVSAKIMVMGIAQIRSLLHVDISVEFGICATDLGNLVNNRVTEVHTSNDAFVQFISSSICLGKIGSCNYEIGMKQ